MKQDLPGPEVIRRKAIEIIVRIFGLFGGGIMYLVVLAPLLLIVWLASKFIHWIGG